MRGCDTDDMEKKDTAKNGRLRKSVFRAAAGAAAAASLAVGSLFSSADELLNVENDDEAQRQAAIVSVGKTPGVSAADAARPPQTVRDRLRAWFLGMPAAVRALVLLPLWAVGQAGVAALSALWSALAPVWQVLLGVLLNALLLIAVFAIVYKLLFPNRSLKELFTKKRWIPLVCSALALAVADAVLRATVDGYAPVALIVKLALGFGALLWCAYRLFGKRRKAALAAA